MLHPWAYDLDSVDMKYIVNTSLEGQILDVLKDSVDAQLFWLSFFKSQLACSGDEFMESIRQLAELNGVGGYYAAKYEELRQFMVDCDYVVAVEEQYPRVIEFVEAVVAEAGQKKGLNGLRTQYKFYSGAFAGTVFADMAGLSDTYAIDATPAMPDFSGDADVPALRLVEVAKFPGCDLQRKQVHVRAQDIPDKTLVLQFDQADTDELKGLKVTFDGDRAIFKIGEGETSHYHIPNDKKLWETQFMVVNIGGKYYIRDMGFVHTTRLKLDTAAEV